jgi:two-component sensor histidine kinase
LSDVKASFMEVFEHNNIKTDFKIASVEIPSDYAMYLGLLLTELSINSIKHAFGTQELKEVTFHLDKGSRTLYFNYYDNGIAAIDTTIKPKLIDKICRQLNLAYTIDTSKGLNFSFQLKIQN